MGGKGSGRRRGFEEKRTVQDFAHRALRISALKGLGQQPGYAIYLWPRTGELIGSVRLWIEDRYIIVSYEELDSRGNRISVQETVLLDSGKRQWFRCPTCNRRAGTLFVVGPPFACRICMRLGYESQRESREERIRTRALRLRRLLNGSNDGFDYGIRDEDLDIDFDEEFDDDLDEELGEGDFH